MKHYFTLGYRFQDETFAFYGECGDEMTVEEAQKRGVNDSIIHVDFMVGADDLDIDGIKPDGTIVPVFRNGTWA